jgi:hypothetical protein
MSNCKSCGIQIPEGQKFCSMCMGDVGYGKDGYYEEWLRQQDERHEEQQRKESSDDKSKE